MNIYRKHVKFGSVSTIYLDNMVNREIKLLSTYSINNQTLPKNPQKTKPIRIPLQQVYYKSASNVMSIMIVYQNKMLVGISDFGHSKGKLIIPNTPIESYDYFTETINIMHEHTGLIDLSSNFNFDIIYKYQNQTHFYINFESEPKILGPNDSTQKYYEQSNKLAKDFGSEMIIKPNGFNSGLYWIPIEELVDSDLDYVVESPYSRNINYYYYEFFG